MADTPACPAPEALEDLLANRLSADRAGELRSHLSRCTTCRTRLDGGTVVTPAPTNHKHLSPPRGEGEMGWLGEYRILGVLGEGGMAIVYDAVEPGLNRAVALKVLKPGIDDASTRERFLREARLVASLSSERVVHVYAVGEANGLPFLAMEKLRGETLAARLRRDRYLPVVDALMIAREAAEGLGALHEHGLIHRDVKPDNLWLEAGADGQIKRVKLIDFGIARQVSGDVNLTNPGQLIGTPIYMAPEQALGNALDGRTDLYALGCVLYRMVTGRTPFDTAAPETMAVLSAVIRGDMEPVRQSAPGLSAPVAEFIHRLMERSPEKRPADAAEAVARLRELEHEERASTSKTRMIQQASSGSHGRTPRRSGPLGILAGVLTIAAAVAVGGLMAAKQFMPRDQEREPAPETRTAPVEPGPKVVPLNPDAKTIEVGVLFSQTDAASEQELPLIDATQFAIDEINAAGGVLGGKVEAVVLDGASDERRFAKMAQQLIDEHNVSVIFGAAAPGPRRAAAAVCDKRERLLFSPGHTEGLEQSQHLVGLGGAPNQLLIPLVKYAYADLKRRKFFVVGSEAIYPRAVGAILEHEIRELGAAVVGTTYLPPGGEVGPVASQITEAKADFVIVSLDVSASRLLFRAMRRAGLEPPAVPTAWLSISEPDLVPFGGKLAGDYTAAGWFEPHESPPEDFPQRYRKRFGAGKRINDAVKSAYTAVHLWKKAVEKADSTNPFDVRLKLRALRIDTMNDPIEVDTLTLQASRTGRVGQVTQGEGRPYFKVVHQTPGPVAAVLFPAWKSQDQWAQFVRKLYAGWGDAWEQHR